MRYIAKSLHLWQNRFDSIGLLCLSLLLFYSASRPSFAVFIIDVVFNYLMLTWMLKAEGWKPKAILTTIIIWNIGILAYFKYLVFFVESVVGLLITLPPDWQKNFLIPVARRIPPGVSFFTFEMVAFAVDTYMMKRKKPLKALDYVNFISFFPKVVAGPIERRRDLLPQLDAFSFKFTPENFDEGIRWLSLGLFMKFVLADNLTDYVDLTRVDNPWFIWFDAFIFTLRIYFDFGGYSFIALGLARFMGVRLTLNFQAPYTSQSINEFWRRWHITLSTWFRDYVFIPLMGSNKNWAPFYLFITFTLSGFWHGASWNFVAWGAYHGALLLLLRYLGRPFYGFLGKYMVRPQFISWGLTFLSVVFGCLFFMETNNERLVTKLGTLATPWSYTLDNLGAVFSSYSQNQLAALILIMVLSCGVLFLEHLAVWKEKFEYEFLLNPWLTKIMLGLTILLAANTSSSFIYFDF